MRLIAFFLICNSCKNRMNLTWLFLNVCVAFIPPKLLEKKILIKRHYTDLKNETTCNISNPDTTQKIKPKLDLVEKIGSFMGYEPDQKWKGFRIMIYSIVGGALLKEMVNNYVASQNEINDFFSSR